MGDFFAPRVDIREADGHYEITAELPGVAKEDIHVHVNDGILTLEAEAKQEDKEEKDGKIYLLKHCPECGRPVRRQSATQIASRIVAWPGGTRVEILAPYSLFNLPHVNQLYVIFRAVLPEPVFEPGPESEDVRLFAEQDIPWHELAFGTVRQTLKFFFEDRARGRFPLRAGTIVPQERGFRFEATPDDQLLIALDELEAGT